VRLQLKFKEDASAAQRDQVIRDLAAKGVKDVRPLFPGATDPMRGSLYIVDVNGGMEDQLLDFLNSAKAVEVAEPEVRRKLAKR